MHLDRNGHVAVMKLSAEHFLWLKLFFVQCRELSVLWSFFVTEKYLFMFIIITAMMFQCVLYYSELHFIIHLLNQVFNLTISDTAKKCRFQLGKMAKRAH